HFFHTVRHRLAGGVLCHLLRGVGRALARTFETNAACARPPKQVALHVGNGDLRVVERRENIRNANGNVLCALCLDNLFAGQIVGQQFGSGRCDTSNRSGAFSRLRSRSFGGGSSARGGSSSRGLLGLGFVSSLGGLLSRSFRFALFLRSGRFLLLV